MLKRVMPNRMSMKTVMVLNDEAHHCYREGPPSEDEEGALKGADRRQATKNAKAARVWISGLEAVQRTISVQRVVDLSATPFFLRGSGYSEGTFFPWAVSDFSLMDAIESGIVKRPRVPVADNIAGAEMPKFRNFWDHIGKKMPKRGRSKAAALVPLAFPPNCRLRSTPSTAITRRRSNSGAKRVSRWIRALLSCATTLPPRNYCLTTFLIFAETLVTDPRRQYQDVWNCFETSMNLVSHFPDPGRC